MTDATNPSRDISDQRSGDSSRIAIAPTDDDKRSRADRRRGSGRCGYFVVLMVPDDQGVQDNFT